MITNNHTDDVFQALAHHIRREILDLVRDEPGMNVGEMAANFDVSRIAVINHLAVLEKAQLIISEREGRTRKLYLNVMPIQEIYERWTDTYSAHWADRLSLIKQAAEAAATQSARTKKDE
ncbi:MAG: ArsR/SmtB family transcription factor [Granulosicoccus sp.]